MIKLLTKSQTSKLSKGKLDLIKKQVNGSPDFIRYLIVFVQGQVEGIDKKLMNSKLIESPNYKAEVAGYLTTMKSLRQIINALEDVAHDQ